MAETSMININVSTTSLVVILDEYATSRNQIFNQNSENKNNKKKLKNFELE